VPHDPHPRVRGEHPLQAPLSGNGSVHDDHLAGVLAESDSHSAAMVEADPGRPSDRIDQRVEDRPVGHGIGSVHHRLGLPIGTGDGTAVEVVTADDDRGLHFTAGHHLVESVAGPASCTVTEPADT
jgi:hypothetical protein